MTNQDRLAEELDKLCSGEIKFVFGAQKPGDLPLIRLPEFAFAGKSNVGKSSLINAITNRKALARVSHTPGRTKQINFFNVRDSFYIVDLPGYGYAKVSKKDKKNWGNLILSYFDQNINLKLVLLLIDSRHGIKENDLDAIRILKDFNIFYWIIFTKCDKLPLAKIKQLQDEALTVRDCKELRGIFFTSSKDRNLLVTLKAELYSFVKELS
ncbi:MAG: ribosome biogenesis GTP-binding protein YihA/YsxC [Rickettsiaceae bacterium]|nr:ribosome biogenesis GTP-binding protein YihA/YsxC [Rickettsiaceae bacterium]